jgi:methanogenic corrinoid protein MtbC1
MPALRSIGDAWEENEAVPANEHFASEIVRRELAGATAQLETPPSNAPLVLLACPEGERHELGLLALNLLLRRQRLRVVYLGADVPLADLVATIRQMSPDAVCLSVTSRGGLASLGRTTRALVAARASTRIFIGGPAVHTTRLEATIPGVLLPRPLAAAAQFVAEELGD